MRSFLTLISLNSIVSRDDLLQFLIEEKGYKADIETARAFKYKRRIKISDAKIELMVILNKYDFNKEDAERVAFLLNLLTAREKETYIS